MKNNTLRIITALIMTIILIPIVLVGSFYFLILLVIFAYLAGYELTSLFFKDAASKRFKFLMPLLPCFIIVLNYLAPIYLIPYLIFIIFGLLLISLCANFDFNNLYPISFLILYLGLGFASIGTISHITNNINSSMLSLGTYLLLFLLLIIVTTDIGAYLIGKTFGKRPLAPLISPKKTIEGAIGGTIISIIITVSLYLIFSKTTGIHIFFFLERQPLLLKITFLTIITFLLSVVGQMGDLVASKIKRTYGIKDFGFIFPGHGGVLDRFDSLLFSGMFFYFLLVMVEVI